jgi:chromosome segregation ATPase
VVDGTAELLEELRHRQAHLEGELAATREQVAGLDATEAQLRRELERAQVEAATAQTSLAHAQRLADEQTRVLRTRVADLEEERDEVRRARQQAEQERSAVIAALGRRARRRVEATG